MKVAIKVKTINRVLSWFDLVLVVVCDGLHHSLHLRRWRKFKAWRDSWVCGIPVDHQGTFDG